MDIVRSIEVSWTMASKVWLSFLWRELLAVFFGGIGTGMLGGIIGGVAGFFLERGGMIAKGSEGGIEGTLGVIAGTIVFFYFTWHWAVKAVLTNAYSDFKVAVLDAANKPITPDWYMAAKVWWSMKWRTVLGVVAAIVGSLIVTAVLSLLCSVMRVPLPGIVISVIVYVFMLAGYVAAGIWSVKEVLNMEYKEFKVAVLEGA
jgi:hypothetical protein